MLLLRLKFDTAYGLYRRETAMSNQTPPEPGGHGKIVTIHGGIFLSDSAGQEASGVRPMWKTGRKQSYKRA